MNLRSSPIFLVLAPWLLLLTGCGGDPKLSGEGYQQAIALFNVCSRKDTAALDRLEQVIATAKAEATISEAELSLFSNIIGLARSGNWAAALARTRKLMESQVSSQPAVKPEGGTPRHSH